MGAHAAFGSGDDRAPVARAQVDHVIARRHFRHVEHFVDQRLRRGHPDDVLSRLADAWLVIRLRRLGARGRREDYGKKQSRPKWLNDNFYRVASLTARNYPIA